MSSAHHPNVRIPVLTIGCGLRVLAESQIINRSTVETYYYWLVRGGSRVVLMCWVDIEALRSSRDTTPMLALPNAVILLTPSFRVPRPEIVEMLTTSNTEILRGHREQLISSERWRCSCVLGYDSRAGSLPEGADPYNVIILVANEVFDGPTARTGSQTSLATLCSAARCQRSVCMNKGSFRCNDDVILQRSECTRDNREL